MAAKKAIELLNNISATGAGSWQRYQGGVSVLVVFGTTFPTTATLEYKGKDGSTAIVINTPTANSVVELNLPQGEYRFNLVGGSPAAFYADLSAIDY